jgi:spore protease
VEKTYFRTDLADESAVYFGGHGTAHPCPGVEVSQKDLSGFHCTAVRVTDASGAEQIGKAPGTYVTLDLDGLIRREEDAFQRAASALSDIIRELTSLSPSAGVLVAGLGNRAITPDAIGPVAMESVLVTRHLRQQMPETFGEFRDVAAVTTGVLGTTGLESGELIQAVCQRLQPDLVLTIDALASGSNRRLCRTIQVTDTGITPGSGVGNARAPLTRETLGIPVVAVGVPTVMDSHTLFLNFAEALGDDFSEQTERLDRLPQMIVTPRDIDSSVRDISRLVGYGINLALHQGLTVEDVDLLVG